MVGNKSKSGGERIMGGWRGFKSYGKSALGIDFSVEGLDKLLEKIQAAGNNIDDAVGEAVKESAPVMLETMKTGAERHERSGDVVKAIESGHLNRDGNYTYIQVGIDTNKHPEAFEAVFQEYGDGHSPGFPDPFIRPAVDENRSAVKKKMRDVLKKWGVPVE